MTDWKQQIEAQIASLREIANDQSYCGEPGRKNTCAAAWRMDDAADSLQALLDVAVAADDLVECDDWGHTGPSCWSGVRKALRKLREVGDE